GCIEHNADDNVACVASYAAALEAANSTEDEPQAVLDRVNLADGQWGCWRYADSLRTYSEASAAAEATCSTEGREFCLLGKGIVLWSIGQFPAATAFLDEGLGVAHDLGDVWGTAYGLTYLSAVRASIGELRTAVRTSQHAVEMASLLGAGYALALARLYLLWHREVEAPGDPALTPQLGEALRHTRGLGLEGLALQLDWVRLRHDVADPTVADDRLLERLQAEVRSFPLHRPGRGTWEVLGLQVVRAFGRHRPAIEASALEALESLIARVIEEKATS